MNLQLAEYYAQQYGGQYIGYGASPPELTKESIMPNVERTIIASAPFQRFVMRVRKVYRWEDPVTTSTVLMIYMVLVYYNLLLPATVSDKIPSRIASPLIIATTTANRSCISHSEKTLRRKDT